MYVATNRACAGAGLTSASFQCRDSFELKLLLTKYSGLCNLNLDNTRNIAVLKDFARITCLVIDNTALRDAPVQQLSDLASLTQLHSLSIEDTCEGMKNVPWPSFVGLTYLSLGPPRHRDDLGPQCRFSSELRALHVWEIPDEWLPGLSTLQELHVCVSAVTPEALEKLTMLTSLALSLETPALMDPDESDEDSDHKSLVYWNGAVFAAIATLPNLQVLMLYVHPSSWQIRLLTAVTTLTKLSFDALDGCPQCGLSAVHQLCCMANLKRLENLHFCSQPHYFAAESTHASLEEGIMHIVSPSSEMKISLQDVSHLYYAYCE